MLAKLETLFREAIRSHSEDRRLELVVAIKTLPAAEVVRFLTDPAHCRTMREKYITAWILGELGFPKRPFAGERRQLLAELAGKRQPAVVRARAILSLGEMRDDIAWRAVLTHQRDPNPKVRLAVAQALCTCHFAKGFEAIYRLCSDKDARVREWAVFGLARPRLPRRRKTLQIIRERLDDKSRDVRIEAVIAQVENRGDDWKSVLVRALEAEGVHWRLVDCVDTLIDDIRW